MAYQTPEQIAEIIAQYEASKNPGDPSRNIGQRFKDRAAQAQQFASETVANTSAGLRNRGFNTRNIGGTGAVGAGAFSTINQLQQGQLTGAIASVPGAMLGGVVTSALVKNIPGPLGKIARVVAPALGAYGVGELSALGAENIKNAVTGQQTGNKPETKGTETPAYIPGTNIPLNEAARRYEYETQLMDREFGYSKQMLGSEVAAQKDLIQHQFQQQLQYSKSLDPLVQSGLDKHMVRSQALLNTQGNIDARLGMLATQGALAKGAQAEAGALARTFAGTNPYAQFAVRQSPNIQFG